MSLSKCVLFDWDGTLCDSDFLFDHALSAVLRTVDPPLLAELAPVLYRERTVRIRNLLRGRVSAATAAAVEAAHAKLENNAELFVGIDLLLEALATAGRTLAVVTGRPRPSFEAALARTGAVRWIKLAACGGEYPDKPSPLGIQGLLRKLGWPDAVFVGNTSADERAAKAAGLKYVGVTFSISAHQPLHGSPRVSNVPQLQRELFSI